MLGGELPRAEYAFPVEVYQAVSRLKCVRDADDATALIGTLTRGNREGGRAAELSEY